MKTTTVDRLLTAKDLAHTLGLAPETVYRFAKEGALPPPVKIGTRLRWTQKDLEKILRQRRA